MPAPERPVPASPSAAPAAPDAAGRLVIVSHRLPVEVVASTDPPRVTRTVGGLASGIDAFLASGPGRAFRRPPLWIGWAGPAGRGRAGQRLKEAVAALENVAPALMPPSVHARFYDGFANRTLWPLCHTFPHHVHLEHDAWEAYRAANAAFRDAVLPHLGPADVVWVHDFHLMLLPRLLRERVPDLPIAYFHHIPFPPLDVLRVLPDAWSRALLEGLLGADVVGFQTYDDVRHALRGLQRLLGHDAEGGTVVEGGRSVAFDAFPIGVDFQRWSGAGREAVVAAEGQALDLALGGRRLVLSVDRLDYTKGILTRLLAFERLLATRSDLRGRVTLLAVVVPSRVGVEAYRAMRSQIEEAVGRINGTFGDLGWTPVVYVPRALGRDALAAHYLRADVALVTPLRDGMNLVAKELLATREDGGVALVLSDMAGAARELGEAIRVNPFHVDGMAEGLGRALDLSPEERRRRCRHMRARLARYDVARWGAEQLDRLGTARARTDALRARRLPDAERARLVSAFHAAQRRVLLLDYDGTLVPFTLDPDAAAPDARLRALLSRLGASAGTTLVVVSGRDADTLGSWLARLPVALVAEHGCRLRQADGTWASGPGLPPETRARVLEVMQVFADRLPGSFVEQKELSLAWHWRAADPDVGPGRAHELLEAVAALGLGASTKTFTGKKVVEVRSASAHKGTAAQRWLSDGTADFVLAAGDDTTDEDLFAMLPAGAWSLRIGAGDSRAAWNLEDVDDLRGLLETLAGEVRP